MEEERAAERVAPRTVLGALLAFAFVVLAPGTARALDAELELPYSVEPGIAGCLSEAAFHAAVRERLAADHTAPIAPMVVVTRIERAGRQLRATVSLQTASNQEEASQTLVAGLHECATLSKTAALAVSLTIERARKRAEAEATPPPPAPEPPPPPAPEEAATRPMAPSPAPSLRVRLTRPPARPKRHRPTLRTHALLTSSYGVLPDLALGTLAGASFKSERWSAVLEAGAWLPSTVESSTRRDGGKAWLVFLSGSACAHRGGLFVCGVGVLGDFRAAGTGHLLSRSSGSTYVAVGGRLGADVPLGGPFSLVVHGDVLAPLFRPSLRIDDELLWRAPVFAGEFGLGLRMSIL
ncbi:MAG: hypothetical protein K0S65_735 [Labilithrix sp.]|nr:hypothetical protein [Labilithrix sp.]